MTSDLEVKVSEIGTSLRFFVGTPTVWILKSMLPRSRVTAFTLPQYPISLLQLRGKKEKTRATLQFIHFHALAISRTFNLTAVFFVSDHSKIIFSAFNVTWKAHLLWGLDKLTFEKNVNLNGNTHRLFPPKCPRDRLKAPTIHSLWQYCLATLTASTLYSSPDTAGGKSLDNIYSCQYWFQEVAAGSLYIQTHHFTCLSKSEVCYQQQEEVGV